MGILDDILYDLNRFKERAANNTPGGPIEFMMNHVDPQVRNMMNEDLGIPIWVGSRFTDLLGLGLDAATTGGKMLTGMGYVTGPRNESAPEVQAAEARFNQPGTGRDIFQRYLDANEGAASVNPLATGALNMALDPSVLLNPAGKALGLIDTTPMFAAKGASKASVLKTVLEGSKLSLQQGLKAQGEAMAGRNTERLGMRGLYADWKSSVVNRVRNSGVQDVLFNLMNAKTARIPTADIERRMVSNVNNGKIAAAAGQSLESVLPTDTQAVMRLMGWDTDYEPFKLGLGMLESGRPNKYLPPMQSAGLQVLYGLANPLRPSVPILGSVGDAAFGYMRPFHNEFMGALGHILQIPFRTSAFDYAAGNGMKEAASEFLPHIDAINPGVGKALRTIGAKNHAAISALPDVDLVNYAPESMFTATDVENALKAVGHPDAENMAQWWTLLSNRARDEGYQFAKDTFGDFSLNSDTRRAIDAIIPFTNWVRVAYPRAIKALASNPTAAAAVTEGLRASDERVRAKGLPSYLTGTIPIDTNTKVLGGIAKGFTGGREGTANVDVLGMFSPVGGDLSGLGDIFDSNKKPIDKALDVLGVVGLGGMNPALGAALYAGGVSDKPPAPMSVYAGLGQAMPGPQGLPSILNGTLNAARKVGGNSQIGDQIETAAKYMVFERTGKTLDAPENRHFAVEIARKEGIYQEAKKALDAGGAFRSIAQYFNPTNVTVTTQPQEEYYGAKAANQGVIQAMLQQAGLPTSLTPPDVGKVDPKAAVQLQRIIDNVAKSGDPAINMYKNVDLTTQEKQDPRLTLWEIQNAHLKTLPAVYKAKRDEFIRANGIKTP